MDRACHFSKLRPAPSIEHQGIDLLFPPPRSGLQIRIRSANQIGLIIGSNFVRHDRMGLNPQRLKPTTKQTTVTREEIGSATKVDGGAGEDAHGIRSVHRQDAKVAKGR